MTFEPCDRKVFRLVDLAYHAGRIGGTLPVAMNAANEAIVAEFLEGKASFLDIERTVETIMEKHEAQGVVPDPSLAEILAVDEWARCIVSEMRK